MRKLRTITAGLIAGTLLSGTASATTNAELEQRIAELEQMVRLLSRKQEVSEEVYVADKTRAATNGTVKAGPDGFALVSPDKKAELKLRGLMQFDGRFGLDDDKDNDTFLFRRVRPTIDGKIGDVSWRITPEFANDDADLVDGYIDYKTPAPVVSARWAVQGAGRPRATAVRQRDRIPRARFSDRTCAEPRPWRGRVFEPAR